MIEHTVTFRLKHGTGSPEVRAFLDDAAELAAIPEVADSGIRRQTSPKLDRTFGIFQQADDESFRQPSIRSGLPVSSPPGFVS